MAYKSIRGAGWKRKLLKGRVGGSHRGLLWMCNFIRSSGQAINRMNWLFVSSNVDICLLAWAFREHGIGRGCFSAPAHIFFVI